MPVRASRQRRTIFCGIGTMFIASFESISRWWGDGTECGDHTCLFRSHCYRLNQNGWQVCLLAACVRNRSSPVNSGLSAGIRRDSYPAPIAEGGCGAVPAPLPNLVDGRGSDDPFAVIDSLSQPHELRDSWRSPIQYPRGRRINGKSKNILVPAMWTRDSVIPQSSDRLLVTRQLRHD